MGIIWRTLYVVGRKKWMFFHRLLSYWFIFPSDVFSQKLFYFVFINLFIILNMPQKRPSTLFYFLCFFCKDGVLPRCSLYGTLPIPYQDGDWLNHNDKRTRQWQSSPESMSLPRSTDFPLTWRSNEKKVQGALIIDLMRKKIASYLLAGEKASLELISPLVCPAGWL